jgi:hypothetical protein
MNPPKQWRNQEKNEAAGKLGSLMALCGFFGPNQADDDPDDCRQHPAKADVVKRQIIGVERFDRIE